MDWRPFEFLKVFFGPERWPAFEARLEPFQDMLECVQITPASITISAGPGDTEKKLGTMPYAEIEDLLITLERHGLGEFAVRTFPAVIEQKLRAAAATYDLKESVEGLGADYDFEVNDAKTREVSYKCIRELGVELYQERVDECHIFRSPFVALSVKVEGAVPDRR